jgi:hypothetical protein
VRRTQANSRRKHAGPWKSIDSNHHLHNSRRAITILNQQSYLSSKRR